MGNPQKAVIVIHGIGDQRQGDTLEQLATSYVVSDDDTAVNATQVHKNSVQLRSHVDAGEGRRRIDTFRADVLKVDQLPDVVFAEVYWADVSRIFGGLSGFLLGVLQILTGLRFVVEAAGRSLVNQTKSQAASLVQQIGHLINRILVGPLVSLNALLLFVVLATSWFDETIGQSIAFGIFSAVFLFVIKLMEEHRQLAEETKRDAIISYVAFAGILLIKATSDGIFGGQTDFTVIIEKISDVFWSLLSVASFLLVLVSIPVFQLHREARPSLAVACAGPCLNVGIWALALSNLWILGFQNIVPGLDIDTRGEDGLVVRLFPLLSLLWVAVVALALVLGLVFFFRQQNAERQHQVPGEKLRLIFSSWGVMLMLIVICAWFVATVYAWLPVSEDGPVTPNTTLRDLTLKYIWLVVIVIGALVGLASGRISRALDLLLDIITYFRRDRLGASIRPFVECEPKDAHTRTSSTAYLKREQIADRFRCLVNYAVRKQGVSELTIMAHSQGTIAAIEQLKTIDNWLGRPIPPIQLITIGSPYSHIYQHYFPDQFDAPGLRHVKKWINIYTVDDYVGTRIDDSAAEGAGPENIEREQVAKAIQADGVGPIGHNGYWTDDVVMQIIRDKAPF